MISLRCIVIKISESCCWENFSLDEGIDRDMCKKKVGLY